jgi:hypothetical protein
VGQKKGKLKLTQNVKDLIKAAVLAGDLILLVIRYKDKFSNFTTWNVSNYDIIMGPDKEGPTGDPVEYVRAYCHTRQSNRNFQVEKYN